MTRVGFIGTGNIGAPMAGRVLGAGHALRVHDRDPAAAEALVAGGAEWADSPAAAAEGVEVVLTSLPGPRELEAVVSGDDGILAAAAPGLVHADLSTISLDAARRVHAWEQAAGVAFLDAPVSGGAVLAERGKLTLMTSGDAAALACARPVLSALGEQIFHLSEEPGTGTLVKLVNNAIFLCAGQLAQEGAVLAAKAGLDAARLLEVLKLSSAGMYVAMLPTTLARGFDAEGFSLALAEKDVALALETARGLAVPMPTTAAAHQTYLRGVAAGHGHQLFTATLQVLEAAAATRVS